MRSRLSDVPARALRRWLALAGAVALGMVALAGAPAGAMAAAAGGRLAAAGPVTPTSQPAIDYSGIHADQVALVTAQLQAQLNAARSALAGAQAAQGAAVSTAAADAAASTAAQAAAKARATAATAAASAAIAATAARVAAKQAWVAERARLARVAVELYAGGGGASSNPLAKDDLQAAQQQAVGGVILSGAVQLLGSRIDQDHAVWLADIRTEAAAKAASVAASAASAQAATAAASAEAQAQASQAALPQAQAAVIAAEGSLNVVQSSMDAKIAAVGGPPPAKPLPAGDDSPTILGPSVLTAADLAAWFHAAGYVDLTSASIEDLANLYLSEGDAEGVRGDIAFAQAVVETGGFASPDAVDLNNYAGIGHCDSCGAGLAFPSPALGVRGQIQLLHTYASPTLTTASLANPLVLASLAPEAQGIRGCCETWQSLTRTWATDPIYGETILGLYQQMLTFALRRAGVPVPAPAG